jgi:hypothetical protein
LPIFKVNGNSSSKSVMPKTRSIKLYRLVTYFYNSSVLIEIVLLCNYVLPYFSASISGLCLNITIQA